MSIRSPTGDIEPRISRSQGESGTNYTNLYFSKLLVSMPKVRYLRLLFLSYQYCWGYKFNQDNLTKIEVTRVKAAQDVQKEVTIILFINIL